MGHFDEAPVDVLGRLGKEHNSNKPHNQLTLFNRRHKTYLVEQVFERLAVLGQHGLGLEIEVPFAHANRGLRLGGVVLRVDGAWTLVGPKFAF